MTTAAERKYINIRKRLDQLGYRQALTVECLPLVEKLFSDLVHTTESLRKSKLSAVKAEKESANFDFVLEPYKLENTRLSKENNELYLELMKLREQSGQHIKELKTTLKKCARETADLKFLNNQYVHKLKLLEKESKAKNEKIQQLQEKNLQAVVQTPGGKKRSIAFRRQRMQIDEPAPPSEVSSYPVPQPRDPYVADLLQVADSSDLVHTTESLRKSKLSAVKAEKESANFDFVLEPYKLENTRLSKENNELYLELMKLREQSGQHIKELKTTLKKCARETADLKFLNNQYVHKLKLLEKESKAKNEKIQQLQEKNLQAVVQTPGGKKRSIAFRRQRMQIDEPAPPSEVSSYPVPQPRDPYVADLLQVADSRIHELQQEVYQLQEKLAMMESGLRDYNKQDFNFWK